MLHRGSPFRLLVTLLLVVAVPFCCCNFHSWFSACASCEAPAASGEAATVAHVHADSSSHHHAAHHEHTTGTVADTHTDTAPCAPGDQKHDCDCGKNSGMMLSVQKSTVELPAPVVVAVLDWALTSDLLPPVQFQAHEQQLRAVERPPTSLLRMHCALIV